MNLLTPLIQYLSQKQPSIPIFKGLRGEITIVMTPDPIDEMRETLQRAADQRSERIDGGTYDPEIGYVGDEDGGILSAYVPNEHRDEVEQTAADLDLNVVVSHTVPENKETVISFEFGTEKTAT